ncbi:alanine racemase [bacterium]|nr:alanine racemase [bacterium]
MRRVEATVDLAAIRHNLQRARALAPAAKLMAAVKGDAYGHGARVVAAALDSDVDALAVAALEEAVELTDAGCESPIVLLEGILDAGEIDDVAARGDVLVLHDDWQLAALEAARPGTAIAVWIKLDTGMNRLGFDPDRAKDLLARVSACSHLEHIGWMTHLARADDPADPFTNQQLDVFAQAIEGLPGQRTIANSGGMVGWPAAHADWVRPGLLLYGASPVCGKPAESLGLQPGMTVRSRLISVRNLAAGAAIGYGGTYVCDRPMQVGVVAVGYGDGYPRHAGTGTPVLIQAAGGAATVPMLGRVSMDMITVDLTDAPSAQVGDTVTLWGEGLSIEAVAEHAGTISYDLMCGLTSRVRYRHANA